MDYEATIAVCAEVLCDVYQFWRSLDAVACAVAFAGLVLASLVAVCLVDYSKRVWGNRRERKRRIAASCANARVFLVQTAAARRGFIDNRLVERWRDQYKDTFKFLGSLEDGVVDSRVREACEAYAQLRSRVDSWNGEYICEESARHDALFGRLDACQREACVSDEVATLVIAGAGSGKTSTVQKKVEYLVRVKKIDPFDILLLAFTNKAADEMTARLHESMPEVGLEASTFHKFGLEIIKRHRPGGYDICEPRFCAETVLHALSPEALTDGECRGLLRFFAFCINAEPTDENRFQTFGDYIAETRTSDLHTLRSVAGGCAHDKTTYQGELVKSFEELEIANWLFLNGIRYDYERKYDHPIPDDPVDKYRVYKPDFYLPDYDIWIEHFGVDKNGEPPRFYSEAERVAYKAGIVWKRKLHAGNRTRLVESYSWWHTEGTLTDRLWRALKGYGVTRHSIDPRMVWKQMLASLKSPLVREFAKLVSSFISLAKSNGLKPNELESLVAKGATHGLARRRLKDFIAQVKPIFAKYEARLQEENALDFNDMINEATDWIGSRPDDLRAFRFVVVDEFQDISASRAKMLQAIVRTTGAKLFCVGDDWQAIYRFAGSDVSIFTHFSEYFGFTRTVRLENTYRNSQELLTVAGAFVMKNRQQMAKKLKSDRHCERPVVCVPYCGNVEYGKALCAALSEIASDANGQPRSVFLLGRHNHEADWLLTVPDVSAVGAGTSYRWKPHPELKISFMTIHKSKGLEADVVVLLNFKNDLMGFPNSISDDPVLSLLLAAPEEQPYAEERRVFYVALTRTRTRVYILTPTNGASIFLEDLPHESQPVISSSLPAEIWCPKCRKGHLVLRRTKSGGQSVFYGCSNYPRCDYTLPKQRVAITAQTARCSCGGFLVPVRNPHHGGWFIGCTEFARLQPYRHFRTSIGANAAERGFTVGLQPRTEVVQNGECFPKGTIDAAKKYSDFSAEI